MRMASTSAGCTASTHARSARKVSASSASKMRAAMTQAVSAAPMKPGACGSPGPHLKCLTPLLLIVSKSSGANCPLKAKDHELRDQTPCSVP